MQLRLGPLFANSAGSFVGNWWQNDIERFMRQHPQYAPQTQDAQ
jgi:hypothetical protein